MFPMHTSVFARDIPLVTWILIAANTLVFFFEIGLPPEALEKIAYTFGVVPARFTHPEWASIVGFPIDNYWPYLTSQFLHGSGFHLFANMWTLAVFGKNVEDQMGHVRYLIFYLLCGVLAGITHTIMMPDSTVPAIGASGAISGVMGAYLGMFPTSRVVVMVPILFFPVFFDFLAAFYLLYWFMLQLVSGTFSIFQENQAGGIAFWAHAGGFVAGLGTFWIFRKPARSRPRYYPDEMILENAWNRLR